MADLPSRGDLALMADVLRHVSPSFSLDADGVDLVIPACPRDLDGLWAAVMAQVQPGSGGPKRHDRAGGRRVRRDRPY